MRFLKGLIADTAKVLGKTEGAVKQLQLRAVRNLAKLSARPASDRSAQGGVALKASAEAQEPRTYPPLAVCRVVCRAATRPHGPPRREGDHPRPDGDDAPAHPRPTTIKPGTTTAARHAREAERRRRGHGPRADSRRRAPPARPRRRAGVRPGILALVAVLHAVQSVEQAGLAPRAEFVSDLRARLLADDAAAGAPVAAPPRRRTARRNGWHRVGAAGGGQSPQDDRRRAASILVIGGHSDSRPARRCPATRSTASSSCSTASRSTRRLALRHRA